MAWGLYSGKRIKSFRRWCMFGRFYKWLPILLSPNRFSNENRIFSESAGNSIPLFSQAKAILNQQEEKKPEAENFSNEMNKIMCGCDEWYVLLFVVCSQQIVFAMYRQRFTHSRRMCACVVYVYMCVVFGMNVRASCIFLFASFNL